MRFHYYGCLLLAVFLSLPVMAAQDVQKPAVDLRTRVLAAYRNLQKIETHGQFTYVVTGGPQVQEETQAARFAMDRAGHQLFFQGFDVQLTVSEGLLRMRVDDFGDPYVKLTGHETLEAGKLLQAAPFLAAQPDFAMYFQDNAIPPDARELPLDAQGRPGLAFSNQGRDMTYRFNPKTLLAEQLNYEMPLRGGRLARVEWVNSIKSTSEIQAGLFTFDAGRGEAFDSLQALIMEMEDVSKLKGQAAPLFELKDADGKAVALKDLQARHRVVVLDFWATWCGPCRITLPVMQRVNDWLVSEKHHAAIYTVNKKETPEQAKTMWSEMSLTLPVLMDVDGKVSNAYRAYGIPMLVIITDGKIHNVLRGAVPTLEQDLKTEITAILKAASAQ